MNSKELEEFQKELEVHIERVLAGERRPGCRDCIYRQIVGGLLPAGCVAVNPSAFAREIAHLAAERIRFMQGRER